MMTPVTSCFQKKNIMPYFQNYYLKTFACETVSKWFMLGCIIFQNWIYSHWTGDLRLSGKLLWWNLSLEDSIFLFNNIYWAKGNALTVRGHWTAFIFHILPLSGYVHLKKWRAQSIYQNLAPKMLHHAFKTHRWCLGVS